MPVRVRLFNPSSVKSVTVNGVQQPFSASEEELCLDLEFAGEKYVRELDVCARADGKRFDFPHHTAQPELKLTTRFTLNADVRQLLEKARPKNFAEMDVKIAGWQMPESKRNPSYSYHNFICERPERLWLVIPFLSQTGVDVEINGEKVDMLRWDGPSSSAFADLTDRVKYGNENSITLSIKGMAPNRFMGPFLLYPDESATDRVLPTPGQADNAILYTHALVPVPPPRYRKGEGPKLVEAKMMSNVTLREGTELRVMVDLPPEKLRRVMFFESGFGWMGQHNLGYSKEAQCWTAGVTPGNRASIQENEYIYVWAEGADGLRSDYCPVKVGWDFTTKSRKAKVVAGAIEAESLKVQFKSRGRVEPQDMAPYGNHWSGDSQMVWWGGLNKGDSLALEVPLETTAECELQLHLSKAEDYGIFRFQLDHGPVSDAIDLYSPKLLGPSAFTLKPMKLSKGKHLLTIVCQGKNPASANTLMGIDYLNWKTGESEVEPNDY